MIRRRALVFATAVALFTMPRRGQTQPARPQEQRRVPRVVLVVPPSEEDKRAAALFALFRHTLRGAGHTEGQTVQVEIRYLAGRFDRLSEVLNDIIARGAEVIVVLGTMAAKAAKQATTTIPVVFIGVGDPVEAGVVSSFTRPGGNMTGITWGASPEDQAKMLS